MIRKVCSSLKRCAARVHFGSVCRETHLLYRYRALIACRSGTKAMYEHLVVRSLNEVRQRFINASLPKRKSFNEHSKHYNVIDAAFVSARLNYTPCCVLLCISICALLNEIKIKSTIKAER